MNTGSIHAHRGSKNKDASSRAGTKAKILYRTMPVAIATGSVQFLIKPRTFIIHLYLKNNNNIYSFDIAKLCIDTCKALH